MRQYEQIWSQLKIHGGAKLLAPDSRHQTIVNMVRKEKCNDKGWRLLCAEENKRYHLFATSDVSKQLLTFTLKDVTMRTITLRDL